MNDKPAAPISLKQRAYTVIFGTETPAGRWFDISLIIVILLSIAIVALDSIAAIHERLGVTLYGMEWFFTILFTVEYITRLWCSPNPRAYMFSFYGVVDLLSILPTYLGLVLPNTNNLIVIRILRVLRIFRILRLFRFINEANLLTRSLYASRRKILVFMFGVVSIIVIFGSLMYVVEGPTHGFTSLPRSIYWAIVTVSTVGYGDIVPQTSLGQAVAALAMVTSYAIIAIPTGIISAELLNEHQRMKSARRCGNCERSGHETDAEYCRHCGAPLPDEIIDT